MKASVKTILFTGACIAALTGCSTEKGPGALGTKNDIVVRNNGLPGKPVTGGAATPSATAANGEAPAFTQTTEQAEAVPAPAVDQGESLPEPSPQVDAARKEIAETNAPVASTTNAPTNSTGDSGSISATETSPLDATTPAQPVTDAQTTNAAPPQNAGSNTATPAPELSGAAAVATAPEQTGQMPEVASDAPADVPRLGTATREGETIAPPAQSPASRGVYPSGDYAAQNAAAPAPAPAVQEPAPAGTGYYKMKNQNAAYSPKAAAAAGTASTSVESEPDYESRATSAATSAGSAPTAATAANGASSLSDPSTIRSVQAAMKAKGAYAGPEDGTVNAGFLNALTLYQGTNHLPMGGINAETMDSLGLGTDAPEQPPVPAAQ